MSALSAFLVLLGFAYLGAVAFRRSAGNPIGLPSGTEYLLLGYALGPSILGVLDVTVVDLFEPLLDVGLGWLGLAGGIRFATVAGKNAPTRLVFESVLWALLTAGLVFVTVYGALWFFHLYGPERRLQLSVALALVGSETSPFAVRWALSRNKATSRLEGTVTTIAHSDELIAMALLAFLATTLPSPRGVPIGHSVPWTVGTLVLGLTLGALGSLLLRRSMAKAEAMTFLVGATVLGTGLGVELGLGFPALTFAIGLGLRFLSRHRIELERLAAQGEEAMIYPILLLAGLRLEVRVGWLLFAVLLAGVLARLLGKYLTGLGLSRTALGGSTRLGLSLGSSGALAIALGFSIALIEGATLGNAALLFGALTVVAGDLTSPVALRRSIEETAPPPAVAEVNS